MKLCKDCRHCDLGVNSTPPPEWPKGPALHYWCDLPSGVDPVSGNLLGERRTCADQRKADLFKPRWKGKP